MCQKLITGSVGFEGRQTGGARDKGGRAKLMGGHQACNRKITFLPGNLVG
jgi:hypothetical protein